MKNCVRTCSIVIRFLLGSTTIVAQMAGQPAKAPKLSQENFKVVVQKEPKDSAFKFYYVFCKTSMDSDRCIDTTINKIKFMASTKSSYRFSKGFSKLIESTPGSQPTYLDYVRLFVATGAKAKEALAAKINNTLSSEQNAQIVVSEVAVKRYPMTKCAGIVATADEVVFGGTITYTVKESDADGKKTVTIVMNEKNDDKRTCKKSSIAKAKAAAGDTTGKMKRSLDSAAKKTKEAAQKAWTSTKAAAKKVSGAATRAKESIRSTFSKKSSTAK